MSRVDVLNENMEKVCSCKRKNEASTEECLQPPPLPEDVLALRGTHPHRFLDLCTVHLSFLIDIPVDYLHLPARGQSRTTPVGRLVRLFHSPRSQNTKYLSLSEKLIDKLYILIAYLKRPDNLCTEGIFRKSGHLSKLQELKATILKDEQLEASYLEQFSVHAAAGAFKKTLFLLDEPLMTPKLIDLFLQIPEMALLGDNNPINALLVPSVVVEKQLRACQLLFLLLPNLNRTLLYGILTLLDAASRCHSNKMTPAGLGTIFAPILFGNAKTPSKELKSHCNLFIQLVTFFIVNIRQLFEIPDSLARDVQINLATLPGCPSAPDSPIFTCISFADKHGGGQQGGQGFASPLRTIYTPQTKQHIDQLVTHVKGLPETAKTKKRFLRRAKRQASSGVLVAPDLDLGSDVEIENRSHVKTRSFCRSISRLPSYRPQTDHFHVTYCCSPCPVSTSKLRKIKRTARSAPRLQNFTSTSKMPRSVAPGSPLADILRHDVPITRKAPKVTLV